MKWVVDTCVILDVLKGDEAFSVMSADALAQNVRIPRLVREKHRIPVALKLNNDTQFLKKPILLDNAAAKRRR